MPRKFRKVLRKGYSKSKAAKHQHGNGVQSTTEVSVESGIHSSMIASTQANLSAIHTNESSTQTDSSAIHTNESSTQTDSSAIHTNEASTQTDSLAIHTNEASTQTDSSAIHTNEASTQTDLSTSDYSVSCTTSCPGMMG